MRKRKIPLRLPSVNTNAVSSVTADSASLSGEVTTEGTSAVVKSGFCWDPASAPDIGDDSSVNATGLGVFKHILTALKSNTTYYVRSYAINEMGIAYGNEVSFKTKFKIGALGPAGGLVFYLDNSGGGMELAPASTEVQISWGCYGTSITGTSTDFGTGQANTTLMVAACGLSSAAATCNKLVFNGFDDWYLPSLDELKLIYANIKVPALDVFQPGSYWSSSEQTNTHAWREYLSIGIVGTNPKADMWWVRAVKDPFRFTFIPEASLLRLSIGKYQRLWCGPRNNITAFGQSPGRAQTNSKINLIIRPETHFFVEPQFEQRLFFSFSPY